MRKYRNKITYVDGYKFDSEKEAKRYKELLLLKKTGKVINFSMQVPYVISFGYKKHRYYADFVITWKDGSITVEDVKGYRTQLYKLKRDLMKEKYNIDIVER